MKEKRAKEKIMLEGLSINLLLIIVVIGVVCKSVDGYKKGMTRELISFVSLIVLCVVIALIARGVNNYFDGKFFNLIVVILLLALVGIAHHLLGVVFFSAKLVTKLPVIRSVDKLLGIIFGAFEVILILWTVYTFIMMMDMGVSGQIILSYTEDSKILTWLYERNYLALGLERFLKEFSFAPIGA